MLEATLNFYQNNATYIHWISSISFIIILISVFLVPHLTIFIPQDYFIAKSVKSNIVIATIRNILGGIILFIGFILLFLPGPGLLSMVIGFCIMQFPKKKEFEIWFVKKTKLLSLMNKIRAKHNKPELKI